MTSFCSTMMTSFLEEPPNGITEGELDGRGAVTNTRPRLTSMDLGVTAEGVVSPSELSRTTSIQDMMSSMPTLPQHRRSVPVVAVPASIVTSGSSNVDAFLLYDASEFELAQLPGADGSISSLSSKSSFNDSINNDSIGLQGSPTSRGVSAIVTLGRRLSDSLPVAVKTIKPRMKAEMKRELRFIEMQQQFYSRHPSLGAPRSYANNPATCDGLVAVIGTYPVAETGSIAIVMERMAGSLDALLKSTRRPIPPLVVTAILAMALRGFDHLHNNLRMMHRDIKPANLMYDSLGTVKLGDFGLCQEVDAETETQQFVGSAAYMAPERLMGARYGCENDIWSLGVVAAELLLGHHPFTVRFNPQRGGDGAEAVFWSMAAILRFTEEESGSATSAAVQQYVMEPLRTKLSSTDDHHTIDFVLRCLQGQSERPSTSQLLEHPCVCSFVANYEAARRTFFEYFSSV